MTTTAPIDETARKEPITDCLSGAQRTWRWRHVPSIVTGPDGTEHWYVTWVAQDAPGERITCSCGRVFHEGVVLGLQTPSDAFFHHMAALHEARQALSGQ